MKKIFLIVVLSYCISVWMFPALANAQPNDFYKIIPKEKQKQAYNPELYLIVSIPLDEPETKEVMIEPIVTQNESMAGWYVRYLGIDFEAYHKYASAEKWGYLEMNRRTMKDLQKKYINGKTFYAADHVGYGAVIGQIELKPWEQLNHMHPEHSKRGIEGSGILQKWISDKPKQSHRAIHFQDLKDNNNNKKKKWYHLLASSNKKELLKRIEPCKCNQEIQQWQWNNMKAEVNKYFSNESGGRKIAVKYDLKEYRIIDFDGDKKPDLIAVYSSAKYAKKEVDSEDVLAVAFGNGKTEVYSSQGRWAEYKQMIFVGFLDIDKNGLCDLLIKYLGYSGSEIYILNKFVDGHPVDTSTFYVR